MAQSGINLMEGAAAGTIGSFGLSLPASIAVGVAGFGMFVEGAVQFAFGMSEFVVGFSDTSMPSTPNNTGGFVGAAVDVSNRHNRSTQGPGPAEKLGNNLSQGVGLIVDGVGITNNVRKGVSVITNVKDTATFLNDARNSCYGKQATTSGSQQVGPPVPGQNTPIYNPRYNPRTEKNEQKNNTKIYRGPPG